MTPYRRELVTPREKREWPADDGRWFKAGNLFVCFDCQETSHTFEYERRCPKCRQNMLNLGSKIRCPKPGTKNWKWFDEIFNSIAKSL